MIVYNSISEYLAGKAKLEERITAIEAAIDALILKLADVSGNADLKEYSLDDGQTKIRTVYANPLDVQRGIEGLEKIRQIYLSRIVGRVVRLRDGSNFN